MTKTPRHGETFQLGGIAVRGVHTPCHTQDSICFFMEDETGRAVFTGDTLFISGALLCSRGPAPVVEGTMVSPACWCGRWTEHGWDACAC